MRKQEMFFVLHTLVIPNGEMITNEILGAFPTAQEALAFNSIADQFEAVLSRIEDTNDIADEKYNKKTQTMLNKAFKELASILFTLWD